MYQWFITPYVGLRVEKRPGPVRRFLGWLFWGWTWVPESPCCSMTVFSPPESQDLPPLFSITPEHTNW